MIKRSKFTEIAELVDSFPAVAILGPRQVGKTTLALEIADESMSNYFDLQSEEDRAKLSDPALYLRDHQNELVILNQIHRVPEIFATLRGLIDEGRRTGRFVILGSAAIDLLRQSSESFAGRVAYTREY